MLKDLKKKSLRNQENFLRSTEIYIPSVRKLDERDNLKLLNLVWASWNYIGISLENSLQFSFTNSDWFSTSIGPNERGFAKCRGFPHLTLSPVKPCEGIVKRNIWSNA